MQARPSSPPSLSLLETQTRIINIPANTKIIQLQYFSLALNIWRVGASFNSSPAGRITFVIYSRQRASLAELGGCGRGNREPRGHRETSRGQAQGDVAGREELVRLQLSNGGSLGGIGMQHPFDEGGRCWVDVLHKDNCNLQLSWYNLNEKASLYTIFFLYLRKKKKEKKHCVKPPHPGDGVVVFLDAVVGLLQTGGLKWRLAHQQSVPKNSDKQEVKVTVQIFVFLKQLLTF